MEGGAAEMLDGFITEPPYSQPYEGDSVANYEHVLGHAVKSGEITADEALRALRNYCNWVAEGEPKLQ